MQLTITGKSKTKLREIEVFAKKLGLEVSWTDDSETTTENNGKKMAKLMEEMARKGGIQSIKDPVAWQREQRKDKPLYGRD